MKIRFILVITLSIFLVLSSQSQLIYPSKYFPTKYQTSSYRTLSTLSYRDVNTLDNAKARGVRSGLLLSGSNGITPTSLRCNIDSDSLPKDSGINHTRLAIVGGTLFATMTAIHLYQQSGWWKYNRTPFHFKEDLIYGLSVDKIGHFYGADMLSYLIRKTLLWANLSEPQAIWIGAGGGLLFATFTEVEDGFSEWGFDRVDWLADLGGALWAPARYHIPLLRTFDIKMSYHPSDLLGNPGGIGFKGQKHLIIDDYEGQTFWLSVKIEDALPYTLKSYWPDFLCIALGYGARGVATPNPHRVYFIAPDIDFTRLIPQSTSFLRTLSEALNFIHPPLPAVRIHPTTILYGIYF